MATDSVQLLHTPEVGQQWIDTYRDGYAWLIEGVGLSGTVYVCVLRDGRRTQSFCEWPLSRWPWVTQRQMLEAPHA